MNILFLGFVVWWSYQSFGLLGVLGFPMMSEFKPNAATHPPARSALAGWLAPQCPSSGVAERPAPCAPQ